MILPLQNCPRFFRIHIFFNCHIKKQKNSKVFISATGNYDLYVCTAKDNKRGWFPNTLSSASNFFKKREEMLKTTIVNLLILKKISFIQLPPTETDALVFAIFMKINK